MNKILKHPFLVSVGGLVVGTLILYFVFGIGQSVPVTNVDIGGGGNAIAVGVGAQATISNQFPRPVIEYATSSLSIIGNDGYIHQIYQLKFYYVLGTVPQRNFKASNFFIDCSEPKGVGNPAFSGGRYYESLTIECWMKSIPQEGEVLFWYAD